jgi:prepilin-type N-terminal cleavage/methylation domain-containing protein
MKQKGFTLVELLAVIVILAVILVIAIPNIMKIISKSKIDAYNNQMELIKNAAAKYMVQYADEISDSTNVSVSLTKLKEKNLIDNNLKNPITNQLFNNITITINKVNNEYIYGISEGIYLPTGMIPVYYDDNDGNWKKADSANTNNNWYDYSNKKWANAVTVTSTNRATYQSASLGTIISMSDINTMFVYIPRYKYRIPSGSGSREIEVIFETKYTTKSSGDAVNTYYTHPAFTFGNDELNGIWVGKFETTGSITNSTTAALTIKPDLQSVRGQPVKLMYEAIKNTMQGNTSTYGFDNDNDTHMMKNIEWGAVAYLTNSRYGKYGNSSYVGANKELYMNNSSAFYTGRSMGTYSGNGIIITTYEYTGNGSYTYDGKCATISAVINECSSGSVNQIIIDKTLSFGASTTGSIYGIYDMSGGSREYVMGIYKPISFTNPTAIKDCSGFSSNYAPPITCPSTTPYDSQYDNLTIDNKYYDNYLTGAVSTGGKIGDATKEVAGWNGDDVYFISTAAPWLLRGGNYANGVTGGIFSYYANTGAAVGSYSFRVVLTRIN